MNKNETVDIRLKETCTLFDKKELRFLGFYEFCPFLSLPIV